MAGITQLLKRDERLYGVAKVARNLPRFPLGKRNTYRALPAITRIYPHTMLPPARLISLCDAVDTINAENIEGDIAECGVWSGGALALAALWDMQHGHRARTYYGFDSFEGLPPPTLEDGEVHERFVANSRKMGRVIDSPLQHVGVCVGDSADVVRQFFARLGIPQERVKLVVGWFQNTIPDLAPQMKLSILRIDGDWYDSTKTCLDHLYDRVSDSGFVIIDDYGTFSGCKKAVDEFRAARAITTPIHDVDGECVYFRKPPAR